MYTVEDLKNMTEKQYYKLAEKHEDDEIGRELGKLWWEMQSQGYTFKKRKRKPKNPAVYESRLNKARKKQELDEFNIQALNDKDSWISYKGLQVHMGKGLIREFDDGKYYLVKNKRIEGMNRDLFIVRALQHNSDKIPYEIPDYGGCKIGRIMDQYDFNRKYRLFYDSPLNMYVKEPDEVITSVSVEGRIVKIRFYSEAREAAEDLNITQQFVRQACREYKELEDGFTDKLHHKPKNGIISKHPYYYLEETIKWIRKDNYAEDIMSDNIKNMEKLGWC